MTDTDAPVVLFTGNADFAPSYTTDHAAGADLRADISSTLSIPSLGRVLVPTGLRMAIPVGWEGQVRPRSGLAVKKGLTVLNSPGTIDADYRGEVKVILVNLGAEEVEIEPGERIAQLVIARAPQAAFSAVDSLPDTTRGERGFGSTGT